MEGAVAGALYGIETLAEGAIAFAKGIANPTHPLNARFQKIKAPSLPRSSHSLCVVKGRAYIFGGEVSPRQPVDNAMHMVVLPSTELTEADYQAIPARAARADGPVPVARVGHSAAAIGNYIYVFGGRGGPDMNALDEKGRVWVFDTTSKTWDYLDPNSHSPAPEARSYHASIASEHPLPIGKPNVANVLLDEPIDSTKDLPEPPPPNTYGTFFVHAGCLASGRTGDLWAFDISARSWAKFPDAPGPARGGTSLAIVKDRIYRFGGFDGKTEVGGKIDYLDLTSSTFNDKGGRGEMSLSANGDWKSNTFPPLSKPSSKPSDVAANTEVRGPKNRSVAGLVPVTTGQGRNYLLVLLGESTPSTEGHAGAGKFLDDIWAFQLKPGGMTAASVKDASRQAIKWGTGEAECSEVKYYGDNDVLIQEGQNKPLTARGWFASSNIGDAGDGGSVLVWGGVGEDNQRLGDGWIISVS